MEIVIKNQSEQPIYVQIKEQVREQILSGELPAGTVLPSIRKLARELGVSVITTTRAYSDLEAEGFIVSVQGKGSIVRGQDNALFRERTLRRIEEQLRAAATDAARIGVGEEELARLLHIFYREGEK